MAGTVHEDHWTCLFISRSVRLRIKNISDRIVEKIKTHFLSSVTFFRKFVFYEIMCKNIVKADWPDTTTWPMHILCWLTEATKTHFRNNTKSSSTA
jgi:hypothetical protein